MMAVGSQSMFVYDSGSSLLDLIKTKSLGAVAQHVGHFVSWGYKLRAAKWYLCCWEDMKEAGAGMFGFGEKIVKQRRREKGREDRGRGRDEGEGKGEGEEKEEEEKREKKKKKEEEEGGERGGREGITVVKGREEKRWEGRGRVEEMMETKTDEDGRAFC